MLPEYVWGSRLAVACSAGYFKPADRTVSHPRIHAPVVLSFLVLICLRAAIIFTWAPALAPNFDGVPQASELSAELIYLRRLSHTSLFL